MKSVFISQNKPLRWLGCLGIILVILEPWIAALQPTIGWYLAGTGIIGLATYLEFLPYFRKNFARRCLLVGILLFLLLMLAGYTFGVFALLKR
ncbi:hypothetical protein ACFP1L_05765 [Lactiplantibacillus nangangensis]|uniref:Integral membrane protein n=1 Tax=Lactiplantibacillus nangangensis TaxID=2559917 RepID=A0ABW1SIP2_9LACO|nr:hypothetical protein [Lactiplantibacillus nangangensis]